MTDAQEKKDLLQSYWDALDALDEIFDAIVEAHENDCLPQGLLALPRGFELTAPPLEALEQPAVPAQGTQEMVSDSTGSDNPQTSAEARTVRPPRAAAWIVIPPAVVTGKEFVAAYAALIRANETVYDCLSEYGTKSPSEQIASIWDAKAALDEADSALSRCGARLLRLCGPCDGEE